MAEMSEDRKRRFVQPVEAIIFDNDPEEPTGPLPESLPNDNLRQAARLLWEGYP